MRNFLYWLASAAIAVGSVFIGSGTSVNIGFGVYFVALGLLFGLTRIAKAIEKK